MLKRIELHDGCSVIFEGAKTAHGDDTLFVASKEADEESFSCDFILTKDDAKKMRDALDEWLRDEESRCDEDSAA